MECFTPEDPRSKKLRRLKASGEKDATCASVRQCFLSLQAILRAMLVRASGVTFVSVLLALACSALASAYPRGAAVPRPVRAFGVELKVPADWHVVYEATDLWASSPEGPAELEATVGPAPNGSLSAAGAATARALRASSARAHPSTHLLLTTVGRRPAVLLTWQYDAVYEFGPHGGSPHHVRLCGRDYLFIHRGRIYDFSYQTIRDRLVADGRVFTDSIDSLRFTS